MADAYVLAMWCPVFSRHDSYSRFRTELENLFGHYSVSSLLLGSVVKTHRKFDFRLILRDF